MYRPKVWEELRLGYRRVDISDEVYHAYEAGADAMLEGLKKNGRYVNGEDIIIAFCESPTVYHFNDNVKGCLVFIPEESND